MTSLKLKDWEPGKYSKRVQPTPEMFRQLEVKVLEELKNQAPEGCFLLDCRVEATFYVQGTKDELVVQKGKSWSVRFDIPPLGMESPAAAEIEMEES